MGRVWSGSGPGPFYFFGSRLGPDPEGPKFSDPDPDPTDLTGLGSLMGLIQSLFDLSKLNLFESFCIFLSNLLSYYKHLFGSMKFKYKIITRT